MAASIDTDFVQKNVENLVNQHILKSFQLAAVNQCQCFVMSSLLASTLQSLEAIHYSSDNEPFFCCTCYHISKCAFICHKVYIIRNNKTS